MTIKTFLCLLFLSPTVLGDFNQYVPDQSGDSQLDEQKATSSSHIPDNQEQGKFKGTGLSGHLDIGANYNAINLNTKERILNHGYIPEGQYELPTNYTDYKNNELYRRVNNASKDGFAFTYIYDDYAVEKVGSDTYEKTFRRGSGSIRGGSLHFLRDYYKRKGIVNLSWGLQYGFGFNQGRGFFISGEKSETRISLWTIPIDAVLKAELLMGSRFKLTAFGGPSVMGLYQTRNDRDNNEKGKRVRQVGYGYYAQGLAQFSIMNTMGVNSYDMFSEYEATNMYLNLTARFQSYGNFADEITISGMSFGLGFSFEYL